jgi:hypothetical protein
MLSFLFILYFWLRMPCKKPKSMRAPIASETENKHCVYEQNLSTLSTKKGLPAETNEAVRQFGSGPRDGRIANLFL